MSKVEEIVWNENLCILPVIQVRCPTHPEEDVIRVCIAKKCESASPFVCALCIPQHDNTHHLEEKDTFLLNFSREIERGVRGQQQLYEETIGQKANMSLLRWIEDCDNHVGKLSDYIKAQKFQMQQDIEELTKGIAMTLKQVQEKTFQQFDEFLTTYKSSLETFKLFKDDVFQLSQKYRSMRNPNVLAAKLVNQTPQRAAKLIRDTKHALDVASQMQAHNNDFLDNIHLSLAELNKLIDHLPSYTGVVDELILGCSEKITQYYDLNIKIHSLSPITLTLSNYKENRIFQPDLKTQGSQDKLQVKEISQSQPSIPKQQQLAQTYKLRQQCELNSNEGLNQIQQRNLITNFNQKSYDLSQNNGNNGLKSKFPNFNVSLTNNLDLLDFFSQGVLAGIPHMIGNQSFHEISHIDYVPMKLSLKQIGTLELPQQDENHAYTSFCYLGYNLLALAGKEPHVYDMLSKTVIMPQKFLLHRHYADLISIVPISPHLQPLHLKNKIIFASSSQDSTVILWTLDQNKILASFQKLLGFLLPVHYILDLADGVRILTADSSNEISLLEYHSFKWCHSKKLSSFKVTGMKMSGCEQVVISFEDGQISVIQLLIQYGSASFEEVERFETGVQGVSSLGLIPNSWDKKNFFILGCNDGIVRLFDIQNKKVATSMKVSEGLLVDNVIIRENKKCAFSIVFCAQGDKRMKAYHFAESSQDNVIIQEEDLLTMTDSPCFLQGQFKMQVIPSFEEKNNSPIILILTELMNNIIILSINSAINQIINR